MANHKAALKKVRQDRVRRERNRSKRSRLRTQVKKFRQALADRDLDAAKSLLSETLSLVDHTARHGAIPGNAADRTKSRLTRALNRLAAGS